MPLRATRRIENLKVVPETRLLPGRPIPLKDDLEVLRREVERLRQARVTTITEKDYAYDWGLWIGWCDRMQQCAYPAAPETLALYVADILRRGRTVKTAY